MIEIIDSKHYQKMLWKNGAGYTFEIAKFPDNAVDFDWRISMADVTTSGLFSKFENKWRYLSVLDGAGLHLKVNQQAPVSIQAYELFSFNGTATVDCALISGKVRDFNLIFNPDKCHAKMQWLSVTQDISILSYTDELLIFNPSDAVTIFINQERHVLERMATLRINYPTEPITLYIPKQNHQFLCLIELNLKAFV